MKNKLTNSVLAVFLAATFMLTSCMSLTHTVGDGPQGNTEQVEKQWYALWGLVPINDVDSHAMAAGNENYEIESEITFIDFLIGAVLGFATIQTQTVTVTY